MIIQAKPLSHIYFNLVSFFIRQVLKVKFNKLVLSEFTLRSNHSYLLMCNHTSFWDGILAFYLCNELIRKKVSEGNVYTMVLEKQMQKNWWLKYAGAFSIAPGKSSVAESLAYATDILETPGNILLMYPQGKLESQYVRHIEVKDGIFEIASRVNENCQLIWCSILFDYFESLKPSIYFNLFDAGNKDNVDLKNISDSINAFHLKAIKKQFRYTIEP